MIKTETVMIGNREFIHTYSDANKYIVRDGVEYGEAYDPADLNREYTEGNYIEGEETLEEILGILTGDI